MAETVEQYKQRILSHLAGREPLKVLAATPARLEKLLARAAGTRLGRRPAPGKWSAKEIVAHLADVEMAIGNRIRFILGQPGVAIAAFDQDAWASAMQYAKRPVAESLAAFQAMRAFNLKLLKSLRPEQWQHHGQHAERGRESVADIVRMLGGHDLNHVQQIDALVK